MNEPDGINFDNTEFSKEELEQLMRQHPIIEKAAVAAVHRVVESVCQAVRRAIERDAWAFYVGVESGVE